MERKLTTIVSMDVVGYSGLMENDETGTLARLKDIRGSVVDPAIERYAGRTVKLMGDGALVEFASVVGALQCAVDIQQGLAERNRTVDASHRLHLRIGLHLGDIIVDGNDIYGDGVNVAARLEGMAQAGDIVLSKQVYDHIGSNLPVPLVALGEQSVKNISRPIEAYRVDFAADGANANVIRFADFELDTARFELRKAGTPVPVEPQVFDLLVFLARNQDRTVTREEILAAVWGGRIVSDAALSSRIKAARRALGDDGTSQHMIATVHGRGFRFVPAVESPPAGAGEPHRPEVPAAAARRPAVAVLPFVNLNRDPDEDYLGDGIAEDIT
ncbi:MAG: winged helix-turn-helix domain-containing protein, partial [Hyphomicrobiales bacterium]